MRFGKGKLSRRRLLGGAAGVSAALGLHEVVPHQGLHHAVGTAFAQDGHGGGHDVHGGGGGATTATHPLHAGAVGTVDPRTNGFDPQAILRDFDRGRLVNGAREWELVAEQKTIEVAPGVSYGAWAYNGRVPGPTLRAREGERLRIRFVNGSQHPHTIHFHGIHTARMDGVPGIGAGDIAPGESATYEFDATPFGLHLYHCHSMPLAEHIAKGLYGAFVVDPKQDRAEADELLMVMNGFDTNFDRSNEVYAVNTVAFEYMHRPVVVRRDQLVRIYLVNALEFDPVNSFHVHANFFDYYPTGTRLEPRDYTDTIVQGQGERGILELRFPHTGKYMFHAHVSEFAELGWMGLFEVTD
jgi:FtsP/CotA-like multicopper oxidase with cupredoxin domain